MLHTAIRPIDWVGGPHVTPKASSIFEPSVTPLRNALEQRGWGGGMCSDYTEVSVREHCNLVYSSSGKV